MRNRARDSARAVRSGTRDRAAVRRRAGRFHAHAESPRLRRAAADAACCSISCRSTKVEVSSVGKIFDVFLGRGIGDHEKTKNNADGMAKTLDALDELDAGLIFVNLVDFDQLYGHRNDVEGYARALEEFDAWLPSLYRSSSRPTISLILTADHGCDPTTPSTDHSREYVPLLAYRPRKPRAGDLGLRATLSDIGQTVAENFGTRIGEGNQLSEPRP